MKRRVFRPRLRCTPAVRLTTVHPDHVRPGDCIFDGVESVEVSGKGRLGGQKGAEAWTGRTLVGKQPTAVPKASVVWAMRVERRRS